MAQAFAPHEMRGRPGGKQPARLNGQRLEERRSLQAAGENGNGAEELIIEGQPLHHGLHSRRHDVDGEHLPAEEILEGIDNENDGRDFQDPEGHHGEGVGDEELHESRHQHREAGIQIGGGVVGQADVVPVIKEDQGDGREGDEGVNQPAAQKDTEAVAEITDRLGEKRIDLSFPDVRRDLPLVFRGRDQIAHQDGEEIIIDHRPVIVAVQAAAAFLEDLAPEKNRAGERDQPEQRA